MKKILKRLYFRNSWLTRPLFGGNGHILMFHRVCPSGSRLRLDANLGMEVTPDELKKIIRFFSETGYEFLSLDQMADGLIERRLQKKFIVFTFDDGYIDNFLYAYPVFKENNIPFTIYVTTSFPDRQAILWWYLLEKILLDNNEITLELDGTKKKFPCGNLKEKNEAFFKVRSVIMKTAVNDLLNTLERIFEPFGLDLYHETSTLAMTWGQIKQLSLDPLVTIGAHTVNHFALSQLPLSTAKNEIQSSKQIIESHLKKEVRHFAYPFGGKDEAGLREFNLVKETGFTSGVTTRFANIFLAHKKHLECLPRIFIHRGADENFFNQIINGSLHGLANRFKRIVTI